MALTMSKYTYPPDFTHPRLPCSLNKSRMETTSLTGGPVKGGSLCLQPSLASRSEPWVSLRPVPNRAQSPHAPLLNTFRQSSRSSVLLQMDPGQLCSKRQLLPDTWASHLSTLPLVSYHLDLTLVIPSVWCPWVTVSLPTLHSMRHLKREGLD